jgi:hypothetical protein
VLRKNRTKQESGEKWGWNFGPITVRRMGTMEKSMKNPGFFKPRGAGE